MTFFFLLPDSLCKLFFLTVIWLPHGQLYAVFKERTTLTRCSNHCVLSMSTRTFPRTWKRGWISKPSRAPSGD